MNILRRLATELLGLFVDDWAFAVSLLAWVFALFLLKSRFPGGVAAPMFFLGIAVLTLFFLTRKARTLRR